MNRFSNKNFLKNLTTAKLIQIHPLEMSVRTKNNQLKKIIKLVIEYHHNLGNQKSSLSEFLKVFEKNGFDYLIDARNIPINYENTFQDVLLYLYKIN